MYICILGLFVGCFIYFILCGTAAAAASSVVGGGTCRQYGVLIDDGRPGEAATLCGGSRRITDAYLSTGSTLQLRITAGLAPNDFQRFVVAYNGQSQQPTLIKFPSPELFGKSASLSHSGTPHNYPQNCTFTFDDNHPHLIQPSVDRLHSPPLTASRSTQPFCHSTLSRQTDRQTDVQTDRCSRRQVYTNVTYAELIEIDALIRTGSSHSSPRLT